MWEPRPLDLVCPMFFCAGLESYAIPNSTVSRRLGSVEPCPAQRHPPTFKRIVALSRRDAFGLSSGRLSLCFSHLAFTSMCLLLLKQSLDSTACSTPKPPTCHRLLHSTEGLSFRNPARHLPMKTHHHSLSSSLLLSPSSLSHKIAHWSEGPSHSNVLHLLHSSTLSCLREPPMFSLFSTILPTCSHRSSVMTTPTMAQMGDRSPAADACLFFHISSAIPPGWPPNSSLLLGSHQTTCSTDIASTPPIRLFLFLQPDHHIPHFDSVQHPHAVCSRSWSPNCRLHVPSQKIRSSAQPKPGGSNIRTYFVTFTISEAPLLPLCSPHSSFFNAHECARIEQVACNRNTCKTNPPRSQPCARFLLSCRKQRGLG